MDSAKVNIYGTMSGETLYFDVIDGTGHSEALKITSGARDITIYAKQIIGGNEDCVDINNKCESITVNCDEWVPNGNYLATIKGESSGITLAGKVTRHAKKVTVECGNWSDQGNGPTSRVTANLSMSDGSAFTYRLLNYEGKFHGTNPKKCVLRLPLPIARLWVLILGFWKSL